MVGREEKIFGELLRGLYTPCGICAQVCHCLCFIDCYTGNGRPFVHKMYEPAAQKAQQLTIGPERKDKRPDAHKLGKRQSMETSRPMWDDECVRLTSAAAEKERPFFTLLRFYAGVCKTWSGLNCCYPYQVCPLSFRIHLSTVMCGTDDVQPRESREDSNAAVVVRRGIARICIQ